MLQITCPVCDAEGDETEFTYGHQAHIVRPVADKATPESWKKYLFDRDNEKAFMPSAGCTPMAAASGSMPCATR